MTTVSTTTGSVHCGIAAVIPPFKPHDEGVQRSLRHIIYHAPVLNLTETEACHTLRLLRLQVFLADRQHGRVNIYHNDARLQAVDNLDRFFALLLECQQAGTLLNTRRCISVFGGTKYLWRKQARLSAISVTTTAFRDDGQGYYGCGWTIAPNILTLRKWIVSTSNVYEYQRLRT